MLFWTGLVVALAAAARSTWSPCGLSMLSSITPFGERARRHRYSVTAGWFVVGGLAGGLCLGGLAAAGAAIVGAAAGPAGPGAGLVAAGGALALVGALVDAGGFGPVLPVVRRQVDDRWLARYRPWVYGIGFGWQIGVGVATYVMTAGVLVVFALAVLTGSPAAALVLGAVFGLARGSTVFLTAGCADPADLRALHGRLDRIGPGVRGAAAGVQGGAAVGLAVAAGLTASGIVLGPTRTAGLALGAVAGGAVGWALAGYGNREPRPSGWVRLRGGSVVAASLAAAVALSACSSGSPSRVGQASTGSSGATSTSPAVPSTSRPASVTVAGQTVPGQLPTAFDCGGGAYKPATLLVVCGVNSTTVTGVAWSSWTTSGASGHGTVNLPGKPPAPADLILGQVVATGQGPQFSRLAATWTGSSPDGRRSDVFVLATAPASR